MVTGLITVQKAPGEPEGAFAKVIGVSRVSPKTCCDDPPLVDRVLFEDQQLPVSHCLKGESQHPDKQSGEIQKAQTPTR